MPTLEKKEGLKSIKNQKKTNQNLSEETMSVVNTVIESMKKGEITILAENDGSLIG